MNRFLHQLRRVLPAPPRTLDTHVIQAITRPARPTWMTERDRLSVVFERFRDIVQHGELTMGAVVMANDAMWEPGSGDAPGSVVYSFDPVLIDRPDILQSIGNDLFGFHDSDQVPRDPWQRLLLDRLHSGFERTFHQPLPPELTNGFVAYESSCMLFRSHLPNGVLDRRFLPLLVLRSGPPPHPCLMVPATLWPDGL